MAKLSPITGLLSALFPTLVYGFMGSSRHLSIGPEALVAILFGSGVRRFQEINVGVGVGEIVASLGFLVGAFTFLLGLCRLGMSRCEASASE